MTVDIHKKGGALSDKQTEISWISSVAIRFSAGSRFFVQTVSTYLAFLSAGKQRESLDPLRHVE